jgi:REP element-mobilizing transposase RayT
VNNSQPKARDAQGLPKRTQLPHTPPEWVPAGESFFITICCSPRHTDQLANSVTFSRVREAFEHYAIYGKLWAHLVLAMPDPMHAIVALPIDRQMSATIRNLKRFLAKSAGICWQDGFFDHRLRSNESFEEKAHYIRMNPVRAQLVTKPEDWPYTWSAVGPTAR